jgi:hypothetical protein
MQYQLEATARQEKKLPCFELLDWPNRQPGSLDEL